jgi:hypothetical protein
MELFGVQMSTVQLKGRYATGVITSLRLFSVTSNKNKWRNKILEYAELHSNFTNVGVQETSQESRGKRPLKTPARTWNNTIKMELGEIWC